MESSEEWEDCEAGSNEGAATSAKSAVAEVREVATQNMRAVGAEPTVLEHVREGLDGKLHWLKLL